MATFQVPKGGTKRAMSDEHGMPEGYAHLMVEDVQEDEQNGTIKFNLLALCHEKPHGIGAKREHTVFTTDSDEKKQANKFLDLLRWAVVLGLLTPAEAAAAESSGEAVSVDFAASVGRQFVAKFELGKEKEKTNQETGETYKVRYLNIASFGRAIWHPSDSAVADANVPLDFQALADAGIEPPQPSKPKAAAAPAPTHPTGRQPAAAPPAQRQPAQRQPAAAAAAPRQSFDGDDV